MLDHTQTLSSIARRNGVSVRQLQVVFGRLGIFPAGRVNNAHVYKPEDVKRAEREMSEPEVNAQTMGKQGYLEHLLATGQQEKYEAELEYIRSRRGQVARARKEREADQEYVESVDDRTEQLDF